MTAIATGLSIISGKGKDPKDQKVQTPPPDPHELLDHQGVDAVMTSSDGRVIAFNEHGEPVDADGKVISTDLGVWDKIKGKFLPDAANVSPDYFKYRAWHGVSNAANDAMSFIAMQATAVALVAAASAHLPILGTVVAGATAAMFMRTGLNFVGTIFGGRAGHKVDDDPARWITRSGIIGTGAYAVQSLAMIVPGAAGYYGIVPETNALNAYGMTTQSSADQILQTHQAVRGMGDLTGKNKMQDLVTGLIGLGLGAGATFGLSALFGPLGPLMAVPAFLGLSVLANIAKGKVLKFNNFTTGGVRGLAHQAVAGGENLSPEELRDAGRKLPKHQAGVILGVNPTRMQTDSDRFNHIVDAFGDSKYLLDVVHGKKLTNVEVVLQTGASDLDVAKAVYQAQVLSEIVSSPGYKALCDKLGDEKAASMKAIELSVGATRDFDKTLDTLVQKGWDPSHCQFNQGNDSLVWKRNPDAVPPQAATIQQVQEFCKTGELPA